ncbi:MAG: Gfo/Idh/MocA family oxidoreductase [Phycisphaerae bacterium]|nr:Gfo/Idh/MocA family oxidoreductase [Phycisphaerae bacterium]
MSNKIDRRQFCQSTAALGAGLFVAPNILAANSTASAANKYDINVALIGAGAEGQVLFDSVTGIGLRSGIKFKAVCDIWENQNLKNFAQKLGKFSRIGYNNNAYTDYREMLDKEKGKIDAVIIATPDCFHAEHTNACLEAGLHVYCEKEMSNTVEGAKSMVETARKTGKLLQIGHQRRSNPKYRFVKDNIIDKVVNGQTMLGEITTVNGQWNRSLAACKDKVAPAGTAIPQEILDKYGFKTMQRFMNWRWYKGLGGGPIVDLGSHQIDVYSWFLGEALPKSVMASGGIDYWTNHEWYDNVMAIFEFETKAGPVRASYQTLTTSSSGGYFEKFMAENGTVEISEDPEIYKVGKDMKVVHQLEQNLKAKGGYSWDPWINEGIISTIPRPEKKANSGIVDVRNSPPLMPHKINKTIDVLPHTPHLVNFFDAIRDKNVKLNCPAEVGFHTAVMVHKVNEAVEARKALDFKKEDFHV